MQHFSFENLARAPQNVSEPGTASGPCCLPSVGAVSLEDGVLQVPARQRLLLGHRWRLPPRPAVGVGLRPQTLTCESRLASLVLSHPAPCPLRIAACLSAIPGRTCLLPCIDPTVVPSMSPVRARTRAEETQKEVTVALGSANGAQDSVDYQLAWGSQALA